MKYNELGFHWQHGVFFARQSDGSVLLTLTNGIVHDWNNDAVILQQFTIPAAAWASIVASVSKDGETFNRWMAAQEFHGIEPVTMEWYVAPVTPPTGQVFKLKGPWSDTE